MPKSVLSVLLGACLLALPVHSLAQSPVDYFKAGQFIEFTNHDRYLRIYSKDDLKAKFDDERLLFGKIGATPKVLASYDTLVSLIMPLPLDKDYNTWTQDQKDSWGKSTLDGNAVNDWLGASDTPPRFFYWLGYWTMYMAKSGPSNITDWGGTVGSVQQSYKTSLGYFVWFRDGNPTVFKTLLPEEQDAIKAIAKYNQKAIDPLGVGVSKDDISAIQQQAAVIFNAAVGNGKLTP
jgi:hypothetical protein